MSRKNSPIIVTTLLAVMFLILMGCSSSSEIKVSKPLTSPIPKGKTVFLSITANAFVKDNVNYNAINRYIGSLRGGLFERLPSEGFFDKVVHDAGASDYTLNITLTGMRKVSGVTRVLLGPMAGPNFLKGEVELKNNKSGDVLTQFAVTAKSAAERLSGEDSPEDASREFVKAVIKTFRGGK